jgi:hypothetical protein
MIASWLPLKASKPKCSCSFSCKAALEIEPLPFLELDEVFLVAFAGFEAVFFVDVAMRYNFSHTKFYTNRRKSVGTILGRMKHPIDLRYQKSGKTPYLFYSDGAGKRVLKE